MRAFTATLFGYRILWLLREPRFFSVRSIPIPPDGELSLSREVPAFPQTRSPAGRCSHLSASQRSDSGAVFERQFGLKVGQNGLSIEGFVPAAPRVTIESPLVSSAGTCANGINCAGRTVCCWIDARGTCHQPFGEMAGRLRILSLPDIEHDQEAVSVLPAALRDVADKISRNSFRISG